MALQRRALYPLYPLKITIVAFIKSAQLCPQSFICISTFNPHNNHGKGINSEPHFID